MRKPHPKQISAHFPDSFYRVTSKGLYLRDGKILLIEDFTGRSDTDKSPEWELPGGGIDFGETPQDALKREIAEEMVLKVKAISNKPSYVWSTKHGQGRGMDWYYVLTLIYRIKFEDLNFKPTDSCRRIKFFSKEDLNDNISDLASQIVPLAAAFDPQDFTA